MPTIANIGVSVTARTQRFKRGMREASSVITQFGGHVTAIGRKVALFGAAIGGVAAGATAIMVRRQFEAVDATTKLADSLGITTKALSTLQHVGELSGIGTEGMNKAMEQFVRRLGEAQGGSGAAKDMLDRLGLSASELSKDPLAAFGQVADAINKIPDAAGRAQASYDLFGRQGVALTIALAIGSEGLAKMADEANRLGLTFDRAAAAKIEEANDSITRLTAVLQGAARSIAVNLAPFVTELANRLTAAAADGEGLGSKVGRAFEFILRSIAKAADYLELLKSGFHALRGVAGIALIGIIKPIELVIQKLEEAINFLADVSGAFDRVRFSGGVTNLADAIVQETEEAFANASKAFANFQEGTSQAAITQFFENVRNKADDAAAEVAKQVNEKLRLQGAGAGGESVVGAVTDAVEKQARREQFRGAEIDLSRIALEGLRGVKQEVHDPQLKKLTEIAIKQLDVMSRKVGGILTA